MRKDEQRFVYFIIHNSAFIVLRRTRTMPRAKRGNKRLERRKKILKLAKGYRGTKSKLYRSAKESVERGLNFALHGAKAQKA